MVIKGPQIVVEGDYVTLECGVSKYYYHQDIKWTYQALNHDEVPIEINDGKYIYYMYFKYKYTFFTFYLNTYIITI